ncbi:MAG: hypothetical protein ACRD2N_00520 [Vicinamibacterales bacterium]
MSSTMFVLTLILALGYVAVGLAGYLGWRKRMRDDELTLAAAVPASPRQRDWRLQRRPLFAADSGAQRRRLRIDAHR